MSGKRPMQRDREKEEVQTFRKPLVSLFSVYLCPCCTCVCMNSGSGCSHTLALQHDSFCQLIVASASCRMWRGRIKLNECRLSKRFHTNMQQRHTSSQHPSCFYVTDQVPLKESSAGCTFNGLKLSDICTSLSVCAFTSSHFLNFNLPSQLSKLHRLWQLWSTSLFDLGSLKIS